MSDFNASIHAWQVMDSVHYVVRVVDLDESPDGDRTVLSVHDSVVTDPEQNARVWLGEVLLGALEIL